MAQRHFQLLLAALIGMQPESYTSRILRAKSFKKTKKPKNKTHTATVYSDLPVTNEMQTVVRGHQGWSPEGRF